MRDSSLRSVWRVAALIGMVAIAAPAQSVWKKIQKAAQPNQQQQTQPQQPGQKPAKPGQQPQANGSQVNDSGPFTPPAGTKIDPAVMSPVQQGAQFSVSPHGIHVATVAQSGSRQVVIYDGVEGPKFDQMVTQDGVHPIVFSPDGNRWAYCAQAGNEWVIMLDGKEFVRSSEMIGGTIQTQSCQLYFTSNSKHFYYTSLVTTAPAQAAARFVFDGKAGPLGFSNDMREYVFSPDGDHWAYLWHQMISRSQERPVMIVDGKPTTLPGGNPQWTADSKHLFTTAIATPAPGTRGLTFQEVFLDGKPYVKGQMVALTIPPVGNMVVAKVQQTINSNPLTQSIFLVVGGNKVAGSELTWGQTTGSSQIESVVISPDGKHYAAVYGNSNQKQWVFSDGKRGLEYQRIDSMAGPKAPIGKLVFSADSSKLMYLGFNGSKQFLVMAGQELEVPGVTYTVVAPVGEHIGTDGRTVTIDGKLLNVGNPQTTQVQALDFSPDGQHFAFVLHNGGNVTLYLDGAPQTAFSPSLQGPLTNMTTRPFVFSPDSKHLAYFCRSSDPAAGNDQGLCVDGKYVRAGSPQAYGNLLFTSDSNHLVWSRNMGQSIIRVFADGKAVAEGFQPAVSGMTKETWQTTADGSLLVLVQDETTLKRLTITPSASTSIATLTGSTTTLAGAH